MDADAAAPPGITYRYTVSAPELDADAVVALLGELPFHAFETDGHEVSAYVLASAHGPEVGARMRALAEGRGWHLRVEEMPDLNYNAAWEAAYAPVEVGDFLRIRAPFHGHAPGFSHELEIVPEMSFGTGHHETTHLMVELLRDFPPSGKTVLDFGTGTGILALVARLQGARAVAAVDHDPRCVLSTRENAARNGLTLDLVERGDTSDLPAGPYGLILANVNRAVLLEGMAALARRLERGGELWVSGILAPDLSVVERAALGQALTPRGCRQRGAWLACRYVRP